MLGRELARSGGGKAVREAVLAASFRASVGVVVVVVVGEDMVVVVEGADDLVGNAVAEDWMVFMLNSFSEMEPKW